MGAPLNVVHRNWSHLPFQDSQPLYGSVIHTCGNVKNKLKMHFWQYGPKYSKYGNFQQIWYVSTLWWCGCLWSSMYILKSILVIALPLWPYCQKRIFFASPQVWITDLYKGWPKLSCITLKYHGN